MDLPPTASRRCPKCGETKVLGESFYRSRSAGQRGWGGYCKACARATTTAWDRANVERRRERGRRHDAAHPERRAKMRERLDRWTRENPELAKASSRANSVRYSRANPEKRAEQRKRWAQSPKGKATQQRQRRTPKSLARHRENERHRRALRSYQAWDNLRRAGIPTSGPPLTLEQWEGVLAWFDWRCVYCDRELRKPEMEHLTPIVRGGEHVAGNVAPACRSCNARKRHRTVEEYAPERAAAIREGALAGAAAAMQADPPQHALALDAPPPPP